MARQPPMLWWVPILLGFLGITAGFLTIAYFSWVQVAGQWYVLGLVMVAANLAATIAAIVASGMDARTGQVAWSWWAVVGSFVVVSMILYPLMGTWAPR
ncbi:MAG: hypothetical protein ACOH1Y_11940 [Propionicimonas sp.]